MKNLSSILVLFVSIILISASSCNKGNDATPPTFDSIKSILPKQIIWQIDDDATDVVSIKYDTLNHRIELYKDDTTNTNPYDQILVSYLFNNDGYLVKCIFDKLNEYTSVLDPTFDNTTVSISRAPDNKINYIAYELKNYNRRDTTFYTYEPEAGGMKITTDGMESIFEGTTTYRFDNKNNIQEFLGEYANGTFSYNPNNSISKIVGKGVGDNVTEFSYSSGIPDEKEDWMPRLLIGKDYYLWDLIGLNLFQFYLDPDYDNYLISMTNPYHLTRMVDTHQPDATPSGIDEATMTYELNNQGLLSEVSFTVAADGPFSASTEKIKIKY